MYSKKNNCGLYWDFTYGINHLSISYGMFWNQLTRSGESCNVLVEWIRLMRCMRGWKECWSTNVFEFAWHTVIISYYWLSSVLISYHVSVTINNLSMEGKLIIIMYQLSVVITYHVSCIYYQLLLNINSLDCYLLSVTMCQLSAMFWRPSFLSRSWC